LYYKGVLGNLIIIWFYSPMYCIIPNKRIHIQCFIPLLQPNKRIGIFIPFHLHLLSGIVIHFPNEIDIPRTKRGLSIVTYYHSFKSDVYSDPFYLIDRFIRDSNLWCGAWLWCQMIQISNRTHNWKLTCKRKNVEKLIYMWLRS
jgi:hypothetical protein